MSGPRSSGATNSPAPAPAPSGRLAQLEKHAEIRDSTTRDLQQELRRFRYEIEENYARFDELVCTSETFDALRVRVDRHEKELVELRRLG